MNLTDSKRDFKDIKYILTSSMRTKLLISLYEKGKNLEQLRNDIPKPSATILHGLKELENLSYVKKINKSYYLTSNGKLLAVNMIKLIENWFTIHKNETFWNTHDLDDLPKKAIRNIFLLKESECIVSTNTDLTRSLNRYLKILSESETIKIILPICSETHLMYMEKLLKKDSLKEIEIITSANILNSMNKIPKFRNILENDKIKVMTLNKELKVFLTCTDEYMTLSLFFKDNHFDDSQILINNSKNGLKWGHSLFNHFEKQTLIQKCKEDENG